MRAAAGAAMVREQGLGEVMVVGRGHGTSGMVGSSTCWGHSGCGACKGKTGALGCGEQRGHIVAWMRMPARGKEGHVGVIMACNTTCCAQVIQSPLEVIKVLQVMGKVVRVPGLAYRSSWDGMTAQITPGREKALNK